MSCKCVCYCGWNDRKKEDRRKFWNDGRFFLAIKGLDRAGVSLKVTSIEKDISIQAIEALNSAIGRRIHPRTVYYAALRHGLVWKDLCQRSGVSELNSVASYGDRWSQRTVLTLISEFYSAGFPLNCKAIRFTKDQKHSDLIFKHTGQQLHGSSLYRRASKMFGGWDEAIVAAGIKPSSIRAKRPKTAKSRSAHLPVQNEDLLDGVGNRQYRTLIGFASQNPEEVYSHKSEVELLYQAVETLKEDDRALAQQILELLLHDSRIDTLEDAVTEYARHDETLSSRAFCIFKTIKRSMRR